MTLISLLRQALFVFVFFFIEKWRLYPSFLQGLLASSHSLGLLDLGGDFVSAFLSPPKCSFTKVFLPNPLALPSCAADLFLLTPPATHCRLV